MKRTPGYAVILKLFVPVNRKDIRSTMATSQAILDATEKKDLTKLIELGKVLDVSQVFTSKMIADDGQVAEEPAVAGATAGQGGQVEGQPADDGEPASGGNTLEQGDEDRAIQDQLAANAAEGEQTPAPGAGFIEEAQPRSRGRRSRAE